MARNRANTMGVRSVTDALGIAQARRGRGAEGTARALGWLSLGLGAAALRAPADMSRLCGVDDSASAPTVLRIVGLRELGHAAGLLIPRRTGWAMWTRVAGDLVDLAVCGSALRRRRGQRRRRVAATTWAVAAITAVDLATAVRTARGRRLPGGTRVEASVTVNRTPEEAYRFWHDFENLPRFMYHLRSVRVTGPRRSRWEAKAPAGRTVGWDAEIMSDLPNELITWHSVGRTRVPNAGSVRFVPAGDGRGTEVWVEFEYASPGGRLGRLAARVFGENPQQQTSDDLRRFKQVIETGEIARSDAVPQGTSLQQQVKQRAAQPMRLR
ncbi:SRPBCC family protein [Micromonospora sagamiensis]|uniref:Putative membrane protein n=1 Tax=Micromonospora sagamiensis TaxID=47875 RepID=A0A562WH68_9ACTN|nr:SRPBCC family protein [Micromonospora sagamiensis]TWJ29488.1 putative membrane protein [Micromonospora sagamiensis]BCL17484.1 hypothetical protein GCM10017556_52230 [Micromonospora sagamiensis]